MQDLIIAKEKNKYQTILSDLKISDKKCFGHIYVIGFKCGKVKIGITQNPRQRIDSHRKNLGRISDIKNYYVSGYHSNYRDNEKKLISFIGGDSSEIATCCYTSTVDYAISLHKSLDSIENDTFIKNGLIDYDFYKKCFGERVNSEDKFNLCNNRYFNIDFINNLTRLPAEDFYEEMVGMSIYLNKPFITLNGKIGIHEDVIRSVFLGGL